MGLRSSRLFFSGLTKLRLNGIGRGTAFEESHECFRKAMPGGFSWEVLEVYSG